MPVTLKPLRLWAAVAVILLSALIAGGAGAQDVAGGADHPLVGRYEGARIDFHEVRAYDEVRLPDRRRPRGGSNVTDDTWTRPLEGRVTLIRYEGPGDRTALEVLRNHQRALEGAGFETVFTCRGAAECSDGNVPSFNSVARGKITLPLQWDTTVYLLAERNDAVGHVHIAITAVETRARGATPLAAHLAVIVVESEPMQSNMIQTARVIESSEFEVAFARDGRIAVYGITFDFNAADLRPEAAPQIAELAAVLAANPALAVVIVGHTDSIGGFDYNLTLSQRRAYAVVEALAVAHGIDRARMTPAGAGMVSPVATNRTEEGRAQNRRVEIVEVVAR